MVLPFLYYLFIKLYIEKDRPFYKILKKFVRQILNYFRFLSVLRKIKNYYDIYIHIHNISLILVSQIAGAFKKKEKETFKKEKSPCSFSSVTENFFFHPFKLTGIKQVLRDTT